MSAQISSPRKRRASGFHSVFLLLVAASVLPTVYMYLVLAYPVKTSRHIHESLAFTSRSLVLSPELRSSHTQPPICAIRDILWNASGYYFMDLEQGVEYNIEVSHLSSVGVFAIRDPSRRAAIHYRWKNPPEGGRGVLFEPLSSGIHRLEIEGVCHLQVLRYLRIQVDGNATTLKGLLDEKRGMYGYWIWVWQSGAEHPSDLVEVEVKLKVPEEADFNLCSADRFLTEPMSTKTERSENQEKTLVFGNGPEGLLLFVQRVSGEGAYALTVQAYTAYWKAFSLLAITIVVCSLLILGLIVLLRSVERGKNETQGSSGSSR